MADVLEKLVAEDSTQVGAGLIGSALASNVPAVSSTIAKAAGMVKATKAGHLIGATLIGSGTAPVVALAVGGILIIGGLVKVLTD